jgi:Iap family predicted aminopeptidase
MGWVGSTPVGGVEADVVQVDLNQIDKEIDKGSGRWAGKVIEVTRRGDNPDRATELTQLNLLLKRAAELRAVAVIAGQGGNKPTGTKLTHTGILSPAKSYEIPVVSMALEDQDELERLLSAGKTPRVFINVQNIFTNGPVMSANVIGEILGTEFPEQVLVVSADLDSWDLAEGATDNGCGVATALEAAAAILDSSMRPRRTIRFILFTGEEQGMVGSRAYVEQHRSDLSNYLGDINLDLGEAEITGFNLNGRDDLSSAMESFATELLAFGRLRVDSWPAFGSDTAPFTLAGLPAIMLEQDTKEYVVIHHSAADTLDKVDASILARNAGIEAILAFWIADRPERCAGPLAAEQTRQMLIDRGQENYLKISGLWSSVR